MAWKEKIKGRKEQVSFRLEQTKTKSLQSKCNVETWFGSIWTQQEPWAAPFAVLPPFCNPSHVCLGPGGQQSAFTLYAQALYAVNASSCYLFATCFRLLTCSAHPVLVSCAQGGELLWGQHPGVDLPVFRQLHQAFPAGMCVHRAVSTSLSSPE